jgi:plasmid stabilization system protein ParE
VVARLVAALPAVLVLLMTGCGGSDPDQAVRAYFEAIVEQDGEAACEQLDEELRADIERAPAARAAGRRCADVMELAAGLNPGLSTDDVEELEIEVEEDGDRAVATLENPLAGREETIELVQVDGEWRISTLETRPGG